MYLTATQNAFWAPTTPVLTVFVRGMYLTGTKRPYCGRLRGIFDRYVHVADIGRPELRRPVCVGTE